ncbi:hypothetical protein BU23DRAFT_602041 [Bimuria novae-zelandiae CBS 107.79]|uniref:Uncharacterized protein n=1 Tax=Bimuria novae-zelandiae CBS 107.79 TaxID=1447943 RepID=A0A6A5UVD6_9PLEO|nr:hypothetical protein BU23DRAFT_602041 [Bimuria novae-zelandiae CBS 107.79]
MQADGNLLATSSDLISSGISRATASQPQSPLLRLPRELRAMIYRHFTLSPLSGDFPYWQGAYFTCRQMHWEIRNEVPPQKAFDEVVDLVAKCSHRNSTAFGHAAGLMVLATLTVAPGFLSSPFDLLQEVVLTMDKGSLACHLTPPPLGCTMLSRLYSCYLKRLQIVLTGTVSNHYALPYGDMKSTDRKLIAPFAARGEINCVTITYTLQALAAAQNGRVNTTTIENTFADLCIPYQLTIVQDRAGRQTERSYTSATRFKVVTPAGSSSCLSKGVAATANHPTPLALPGTLSGLFITGGSGRDFASHL